MVRCMMRCMIALFAVNKSRIASLSHVAAPSTAFPARRARMDDLAKLKKKKKSKGKSFKSTNLNALNPATDGSIRSSLRSSSLGGRQGLKVLGKKPLLSKDVLLTSIGLGPVLTAYRDYHGEPERAPGALGQRAG